MRTIWILCFLSCSLFAEDFSALEEMQFTEQMLMDVTAQGDLKGMELVEQRLSPLLEHSEVGARAHYLRAFLLWQKIRVAVALNPDVPALAQEALQHIQISLEKDPEQGDPAALAFRVAFQWTLADRSGIEVLRERIKPMSDHLSKLAEPPPLFAYTKGLNLFHREKKQHEGMAVFDQVLDAYETLPDTAHNRWWRALLHAWTGQHYLMLDPVDHEKARGHFLKALTFRPDFAMIRDAFLPQTEALVACPVTALEALEWSKLAEDPDADSKVEGGMDAKSLAFAEDEGMLWFRIDLHQFPNGDAFGINLVLETDGDRENGMAWWGENRELKFDHMATVWVAKGADGTYRGTVGFCSAADAARGRMAVQARNALPFHADIDGGYIVVGLDRTLVGKTKTLGVVAAVGSNTDHHDDVAGGSFTSLSL